MLCGLSKNKLLLPKVGVVYKSLTGYLSFSESGTFV
jgi:hypothetical protein